MLNVVSTALNARISIHAINVQLDLNYFQILSNLLPTPTANRFAEMEEDSIPNAMMEIQKTGMAVQANAKLRQDFIV